MIGVIMKTRQKILSFSLAFILSALIFPANLHAVSTNQWSKTGGQKIFSANISFKNTYSTNGYAWWQGDPWTLPKDQKIVDSVTLKNAVSPLIGQITIQGPGHIALIEKCENHASVIMLDHTNSGTFYSFRNTFIKNKNGHISGNLPDFTPNELSGKIIDNQILTIDIYVTMSLHDVNINGLKAYGAPQSVDMEIWYFPDKDKGGKVIKSIKLGKIKPPKNHLKSWIIEHSEHLFDQSPPHLTAGSIADIQNNQPPTLRPMTKKEKIQYHNIVWNDELRKINKEYKKKLKQIALETGEKGLGYIPEIGTCWNAAKALQQLLQNKYGDALNTFMGIIPYKDIGTAYSLFTDYAGILLPSSGLQNKDPQTIEVRFRHLTSPSLPLQ
jgi:hypothetical protein